MGTYGSTWQRNGYCGCGAVEEFLGSLDGRPAAICGNAHTVFEELGAVRAHYGLDLEVFGVNDVGMYLDRMDHWCSLHSANLEAWKAVRWLHRRSGENVRIHSVHPAPGVEVVWDKLTPVFALSGYFAMQLAWVMGARPIILCGCPGSQVRRFFDAAPRPDFGYGAGPAGSDVGIQEQLRAEMRRLPDFRAAVRSLSGWTADFFGRPEGWDTWQPSAP